MGSKQKIDELMNKNIICNKCNNYSKAINYKGNFFISYYMKIIILILKSVYI